MGLEILNRLMVMPKELLDRKLDRRLAWLGWAALLIGFILPQWVFSTHTEAETILRAESRFWNLPPSGIGFAIQLVSMIAILGALGLLSFRLVAASRTYEPLRYHLDLRNTAILASVAAILVPFWSGDVRDFFLKFNYELQGEPVVAGNIPGAGFWFLLVGVVLLWFSFAKSPNEEELVEAS